MTVGELLKRFRENQKLSQKDFSKILEIAPSTLSKYENNKRIPSSSFIYKVADTMKLKGSELDMLVNEITIKENHNIYNSAKKRELMNKLKKVATKLEEGELEFIISLISKILSEKRARDLDN